ncbi:hypothetical protein [Nonomuraea sp. SYSU D8015]|uniref:hypothetical protein n=1 Tax=Nonomuraea sp. SYSU D8015 TaxID=2593644 RepID=UPI0016609381|nr:hypothetical protein [Nonomuraea sp. SYSU D8015]
MKKIKSLALALVMAAGMWGATAATTDGGFPFPIKKLPCDPGPGDGCDSHWTAPPEV